LIHESLTIEFLQVAARDIEASTQLVDLSAAVTSNDVLALNWKASFVCHVFCLVVV
jgi:hypothetical protein